MINIGKVLLWDQFVGAMAWDPKRKVVDFQYDPAFLSTGLPVAPLKLPLSSEIYSFPALNWETFHGLPGLLSDSLPDRWGQTLIRLWLRRQNRDPDDLNPVERLLFQGKRGMGALEFQPFIGGAVGKRDALSVESLAKTAARILKDKGELSAHLNAEQDHALDSILQVGTSAGGNRAKAVIAWNPATNEVRSGQVPAPAGFEAWILKFDDIGDDANGQPGSFGRVEYAYHLMARAAGIEMSDCRLWEEHGRAHFMTRRFDRTPGGEKLHVLSLCAISHLDYNAPGRHAYEDLFDTAVRLNLGHDELAELFRRMTFNILARNQDDHARNFAFMMDPRGRWSLTPAFDVAYAHNPKGLWTREHQLSLNGKGDSFVLEDLLGLAQRYGIKRPKAAIEAVAEAVGQWPGFAKAAGVDKERTAKILAAHRVLLR